MSRLEELLEIQKIIDNAKYQLAKLDGEDESLEKQLRKKYNCKPGVETRNKIKSLRKSLKKKRTEAEQGLTALQNTFRW